MKVEAVLNVKREAKIAKEIPKRMRFLLDNRGYSLYTYRIEHQFLVAKECDVTLSSPECEEGISHHFSRNGVLNSDFDLCESATTLASIFGPPIHSINSH